LQLLRFRNNETAVRASLSADVSPSNPNPEKKALQARATSAAVDSPGEFGQMAMFVQKTTGVAREHIVSKSSGTCRSRAK
jgi:hypothetical protein